MWTFVEMVYNSELQRYEIGQAIIKSHPSLRALVSLVSEDYEQIAVSPDGGLWELVPDKCLPLHARIMCRFEFQYRGHSFTIDLRGHRCYGLKIGGDLMTTGRDGTLFDSTLDNARRRAERLIDELIVSRGRALEGTHEKLY